MLVGKVPANHRYVRTKRSHHIHIICLLAVYQIKRSWLTSLDMIPWDFSCFCGVRTFHFFRAAVGKFRLFSWWFKHFISSCFFNDKSGCFSWKVRDFHPRCWRSEQVFYAFFQTLKLNKALQQERKIIVKFQHISVLTYVRSFAEMYSADIYCVALSAVCPLQVSLSKTQSVPPWVRAIIRFSGPQSQQ